MKRYKLIITFIFFTGIAYYGSGQDFLFSQFDMVPQMYNPAQTGDFYGTVRLGGIYRDQGFAISKYRYTTPAFFVDSPIMGGFRDQDWIGVGAVFVQDNAGIGRLKTGEVRFSASYHLGLDKGRTNVLTFGIQAGNYSRSFGKAELLELESDITGTGSSTARPETNPMNKWSFGAGVLFKSKPNKETTFSMGGGVSHLYKYNYGVNKGGIKVRIPLTINAHAGLERQINNNISINPMVLAQFVGGDYNIALQSYVSIRPDEKKEFYLEPGIGYRYADAAMLFFGIKYDGFKARLGYDATLSPMTTANGTAGALELAATYIVKINKPPKVEKKIICPRI